MDTTTTNTTQEVSTYWELVKGASEQVKLTLISMLSASLVMPDAEQASTDREKKLHVTKKDLEITPFVASIGQSLKPLPADFDLDKAKQEYLTKKFG